MSRLLGVALAISLSGCWYWPAGTRRPYGHQPLPDEPATTSVEATLPALRSAEIVVAHRPESSVLQPIGGIYTPELVGTITAPDAPLDLFECLADALRAAGLDVRNDYATSSDAAAFDAALVPKPPLQMRIHVTTLRVDAVWKAGQMLDRSRMVATVSVRDPRGVVRYAREHVLTATRVHRDEVPIMCGVGQRLAASLGGDRAYRSAIRAMQ